MGPSPHLTPGARPGVGVAPRQLRWGSGLVGPGFQKGKLRLGGRTRSEDAGGSDAGGSGWRITGQAGLGTLQPEELPGPGCRHPCPCDGTRVLCLLSRVSLTRELLCGRRALRSLGKRLLHPSVTTLSPAFCHWPASSRCSVNPRLPSGRSPGRLLDGADPRPLARPAGGAAGSWLLEGNPTFLRRGGGWREPQGLPPARPP